MQIIFHKKLWSTRNQKNTYPVDDLKVLLAGQLVVRVSHVVQDLVGVLLREPVGTQHVTHMCFVPVAERAAYSRRREEEGREVSTADEGLAASCRG